MVIHSSWKFLFNASTKTISCGASDLHEGQTGMLFEIFTYSPTKAPLTWGICIKSDRTDEIAKFEFLRDTRGAENEITSWELRPTDSTVLGQPQLAGWTLVIFND
jgi:hypothetical protein